MNYGVRLSPQATKFLEKLDGHLSDRIKGKLRKIKNKPFRYLESYVGDDFFKLRIGEYRAIIDVNKENKLVIVRYLNHRRKVYKRFG